MTFLRKKQPELESTVIEGSISDYFARHWANMHPVERFWRQKIVIPFYSFCRYIRYDIHQGFYGLWVWGKFAWNWRPWDWVYGLDALRIHLEKLEPCLRDGHHVNGVRYADEVKKVLFLIDRVLKDDYYHSSSAECLSESQGNKVKFSQQDRDLKEAAHRLGKGLLSWWD